MKNERNCLNFLNQCSYPVKVENKTKCSNASREDNFKENTLFFFFFIKLTLKTCKMHKSSKNIVNN